MRFHKDKKIITMSLMDLEHCGFSYEEFRGELFLNGIDDPEAELPIMFMVDVVGGAVITTSTRDETLVKMEESHKKYIEYLNMVGIDNER